MKRDGKWGMRLAREPVPGNLFRIRLGDIVPADAQLVEGAPMEVEQSELTGESLPVVRKVGNTLYSGSIVRRGENDAVVTATGNMSLERYAISNFKPFDPVNKRADSSVKGPDGNDRVKLAGYRIFDTQQPSVLAQGKDRLEIKG